MLRCAQQERAAYCARHDAGWSCLRSIRAAALFPRLQPTVNHFSLRLGSQRFRLDERDPGLDVQDRFHAPGQAPAKRFQFPDLIQRRHIPRYFMVVQVALNHRPEIRALLRARQMA